MKIITKLHFLVPAAIAGSIGIAYLWLVAPRIIPEREPTLADTSPRVFSAHLAILEGSPVEGKTLAYARKKVDGTMKVTSAERGLDNFMVPFPTLVLKAGDHLIIRDTPDRLKEFEKILEGTLYADDAMVAPVDDEHPLKDEDQQIAEVVLIEGSRLAGRTLSGIRFADRYGMITLAIHRAGRHPEKLYDEIGDILLVQGPREQIAGLNKVKVTFFSSSQGSPYSAPIHSGYEEIFPRYPLTPLQRDPDPQPIYRRH